MRDDGPRDSGFNLPPGAARALAERERAEAACEAGAAILHADGCPECGTAAHLTDSDDPDVWVECKECERQWTGDDLADLAADRDDAAYDDAMEALVDRSRDLEFGDP